MSESIVGHLVGTVIGNRGSLARLVPGTPESDRILHFCTKDEPEIVVITDVLLAALERVNDEYRGLFRPEDMDLVDAAIAKARGEEVTE